MLDLRRAHETLCLPFRPGNSRLGDLNFRSDGVDRSVFPESFFWVWVSNPCFSDVTNYYCFSCARKEHNVKITTEKMRAFSGGEQMFFFCLGRKRVFLWVVNGLSKIDGPD
jgi:hypothetical protein